MNYAFKISMYKVDGQMLNRFVGDYVLLQIIYSNHVLFLQSEKNHKKYATHSADIKRDGIPINRLSYILSPHPKFCHFKNHLL